MSNVRNKLFDMINSEDHSRDKSLDEMEFLKRSS